MSIDFCWRKAAECHRLAGLDDSVQNFFIRSRNSWIELANRLNVVGDFTRTHHEEAWDSIISGTAGGDDGCQEMPRGRPHRLQ
jgi:hypothetical protein